ncbi:MAG: hypothetical protein H5T96_09800 [Tissierellales bacterium]|nr:hypothetical protein [Tissierellales bacterium]
MSIQGEQKVTGEKEYRELMIDSSSSLKDFSFNRKQYYKKYIANEPEEEKDTQAILTGKLVETLLWEEDKFDEKFYISAIKEPPSGMMANFVEALYEATIACTNEDGEITRDFESLSTEAYEKSGYKLPYKTIIGKFVGSDDEIYYNEIRNIRPKKLSTVTVQDVENAERIVQELRTNPITKDIVNLVSDERYTVLNQYSVEGYIIDEHPFKSLLDFIVIDHEKRTVQIYDLKVVWAVEEFYREYFLKRRAYIQGYLYYRAMEELSYLEDSGFYDYEILPPKFIVSDSINYYSPLIYKMTKEDLMEAYNGFEYKGWAYPGVKSIIEELKWCLEFNIWNISKANYESNGVVNLKSL